MLRRTDIRRDNNSEARSPQPARKQPFSTVRATHCLQAGTRTGPRVSRQGFSLLEVVLSLAILGGAMAVLGEAARNGMENARIARDLTDAQLYCESKMAELEMGLLTTDNVADVPIEAMYDSVLESSAESGETDWLYSIESELIDEQGLVLVYVTVKQDPTTVTNPVSFTMTRMMLDESMMIETTDSTSTTGEME